MSTDLYEVLASGMRYWFVFLGVVIVLRSFFWLWQDHRARHRRLRGIPTAGTIGVFTVIHGSELLPEGAEIDLPYEGILGFNRTADVVVPCNGIAAKHLELSFHPGVGVLVQPRHGLHCQVDGVEITSGRKQQPWPLVQGSILHVGEAALQLDLLPGLRVRRKQQAPAKPKGPTLFGQPVADQPEQPVVQSLEQLTLFGNPVQNEPSPSSMERRRRHGRKKEEASAEAED